MKFLFLSLFVYIKICGTLKKKEKRISLCTSISSEIPNLFENGCTRCLFFVFVFKRHHVVKNRIVFYEKTLHEIEIEFFVCIRFLRKQVFDYFLATLRSSLLNFLYAKGCDRKVKNRILYLKKFSYPPTSILDKKERTNSQNYLRHLYQI